MNPLNISVANYSVPANDSIVINMFAQHLYVRALSSTTLKLSIDDQSPISIWAGFQLDLSEVSFKRVRLVNETGSAITATIVVSSAPINDASVVVSGIIQTNPTCDTISTPAQEAVVAVTKTEITANTSRREIELQNTGTSDIWIGSSAMEADSERGIKLEPGASRILTTSAAIFCQCKTGSSSTLNVMELTHSS